MTSFCPSCGAGVGRNDRFCRGCGTDLAEEIAAPPTCGACGEALIEEDRFCPGCGAKVELSGIPHQAGYERPAAPYHAPSAATPRAPSEATPQAPPTAIPPAPSGPSATPNSWRHGWWPESAWGSIGLIVLVLFSGALAFGLGGEEPMAAIIVGGAILVLTLFWRKVLIRWGIIGTPRPVAVQPGEPPAEGFSKGKRILLLFLLVAFLGMINKLGPIIANWFS